MCFHHSWFSSLSILDTYSIENQRCDLLFDLVQDSLEFSPLFKPCFFCLRLLSLSLYRLSGFLSRSSTCQYSTLTEEIVEKTVGMGGQGSLGSW